MEYTLLIEQKRRYKVFIASIIFIVLFLLITFYKFGLYVFFGVVGVLFSIAITPLLMGRYKFFLLLWLFIIPIFDNVRFFLVAGANPATAIGAFLTVPFAAVFIFNEFFKVTKELPFLKYMVIFQIILVIYFFRPGTPFSSLMDLFRQFIEIFIIFVAYVYFKQDKKNAYTIINYIAWFTNINSLTAIFQRVTGIGLNMIENVPRASGLLVHPNIMALVINLFLPMAIYMFLKSETKNSRIFWGASIILNTLALFLTFAKIGYLAFMLMSGILFLYLPYKTKVKTFLFAVCGLIVFVISNAALNLQIIEYVVKRFNNMDSFYLRLELWNFLLSGLNAANIWFGNGIKAVMPYLMQYGYPLGAHNIYVQLLFEFGLMSIFFHLRFLIPLKDFLKAHWDKKLPDRFVYIFPVTIFLQILLNMASDNSVFSRTPMYFSWVIVIYFYLRLKEEYADRKAN